MLPVLKMNHRQGALTALWAVSTMSRQMRPATSDVLSRKSTPARLCSADWPQPRRGPRYSLLRLTITSMFAHCNRASATSFQEKVCFALSEEKECAICTEAEQDSLM